MTIKVKDLWFSWPNGKSVLNGCSLQVPRGEFWMLLGTNGSGKSTLLRLLAGLLKPSARVRESLGAVNLLEMEKRPIYALSGGQKQRIAIAGALASHCEVLLFDEPTALLDGDTQLELVSQVQKLVKNRGITALWVTHRLDELDYSDGAFLLEGGKVTDRGNALELKARLLASAAGES